MCSVIWQKNERWIAGFYGDGSNALENNQVSVTTVIECDAGDQVYVYATEAYVAAGSYNVFTGAFLMALS